MNTFAYKNLLAVWLLWLFSCTAPAGVRGPQGAEQADVGTMERRAGSWIRVIVEDAREPHNPVKEARVFIVTKDGQERTIAETDELGTAKFLVADVPTEPKYLLVESGHHFIGGVRWMEGMREYYILLNIATIR